MSLNTRTDAHHSLCPAQATPPGAHTNLLADAHTGEWVLFLYYTSPSKAAASPERLQRAASGETFREAAQSATVFTFGNYSFGPTEAEPR